MSRRKGDRSYFTGSFTISKEHIALSQIGGIDKWELTENYLVQIESDFKLESDSLVIYFIESKGQYYKYWYTEQKNVKHILDFEETIFSFSKKIPAILN